MSVVVGVDPGRRSVSVLHLARLLGCSTGGGLVVAAVIPEAWSRVVGSADDEWRSFTRASAGLALDHSAAVLGDLPVTYVVQAASSVRRGLLDLAAEYGARLLVVGSSDRAPDGRILLGVGADSLLSASPVPVAIAPRGFRAEAGHGVPRVTVAYDGAEGSLGVARAAAELADARGADLRVASFAVAPPVSGTSRAGVRAERDVAEGWSEQVRRGAARLIDEIGPSARPHTVAVGEGESWDAAIAALDWIDGEILVVGGGQPIRRALFGSPVSRIIAVSPVPVIVLGS